MATTTTTISETGNVIGRYVRSALGVLGIVFLIGFAIVEIVPFGLTVANSFKCDAAVENLPMAFIPRLETLECRNEAGEFISADEQVDGLVFTPSINGYEKVFADQLPRWFFNTAFLALSTTLFKLVFDSMAGYALARLTFPGNRLMFFIVLGTMMIPGVVLIIPRFLLLKQLGLLNSYQGYIITGATDAFGILLMKQFFESIPGEIEEAAMVDGANRFTIFMRIVLPLATPALTALAIFSFQGGWNDFMNALIILGGNTDLFNLPLGLTVLRGSGQDIQYDLVLAGSVITTIPMAFIFLFFQRYFVEGVSYSGLKG
jgi:multiple sugar transport system permease protein